MDVAPTTAMASDVNQKDKKVMARSLRAAVRSGNMELLNTLVKSDANLLWVGVGTGWTPMHQACRSICADKKRLDRGDFDWIVKQATCAQTYSQDKPNFLKPLGRSQETCLDIFFSTWMGKASLTRSIKELTSSLTARAILRRWVESGMLDKHKPSDWTEDLAQFWRCLDLICRAAAPEQGGYSDASANFSMLHFLAKLGSCPELISCLVIALFPGSIQKPEASTGRLPLHLWAGSPNPADPDRDGIGLALLQKFPDALCATDNKGRLPIHIALRSGKPIQQLVLFLESSPSILDVTDPVSGQPCFVLLATAIRHEERAKEEALCRRKPSASLYDWLDARTTADYNQFSGVSEESCFYVAVLFSALRACPHAIQIENLRTP